MQNIFTAEVDSTYKYS